MSSSDVGALCLAAAFIAASFGAVAAPLGARRGNPALVAAAQHVAFATAGLLVLAALLLERALLGHDFAVRFVAESTNRAMPARYLAVSLWGGQAGSLLYWCLVLTLLSAAASRWIRRRYPALHPDALGALLGIQVFFLGMVALVSNPFERLPVVPVDGRGLNPLLMDQGMQIHPPVLLAGFASFSVPFALAIAALATGRTGTEWVRAVRPWAVLAWVLQGGGLLLGAWWAYHVLGWGGYWGWDPVENAALLPWLVASALLHSLMVQERRGMMKLWNVTLTLTGFGLAVFGTFAVRSGVLSSVHSFAQSSIGPFFFGFLGVVAIGSVALVLYRLPTLRADGELDSLVSREAAILANNLLLIGAMLATLWGTIVPLLSEALRGAKMAVGPQFFQQVNGPIFLVLLLLLGLGPPLGWRRTSRRGLVRIFRWPIAAAAGVVLLLVAMVGPTSMLAALAFGASALVAGTIGGELVRGTAARRQAGASALAALAALVARDRRRYGGYLVHLAIALLAVGVVASSFFQTERTVALRPGQAVEVGPYTLTFNGLFVDSAPGQEGIYADLLAHGPGGAFELHPERRTYRGWESQPTTGVAIQTVWPRMDDLYVLLASTEDDGSVALRVFVNPLVALIWLGGVLLFVGAAVASFPSAQAGAARSVAPALLMPIAPAETSAS